MKQDTNHALVNRKLLPSTQRVPRFIHKRLKAMVLVRVHVCSGEAFAESTIHFSVGFVVCLGSSAALKSEIATTSLVLCCTSAPDDDDDDVLTLTRFPRI